jgi:hypothetical protein
LQFVEDVPKPQVPMAESILATGKGND